MELNERTTGLAEVFSIEIDDNLVSRFKDPDSFKWVIRDIRDIFKFKSLDEAYEAAVNATEEDVEGGNLLLELAADAVCYELCGALSYQEVQEIFAEGPVNLEPF